MKLNDAQSLLVRYGVDLRTFHAVLAGISHYLETTGQPFTEEQIVESVLAGCGFKPQSYQDDGLFPAALYCINYCKGMLYAEMEREAGIQRNEFPSDGFREGYESI